MLWRAPRTPCRRYSPSRTGRPAAAGRCIRARSRYVRSNSGFRSINPRASDTSAALRNVARLAIGCPDRGGLRPDLAAGRCSPPPKLGCFNIHASLLPRWRGAAPIQRAILAGDATTGVAIMRMEAGLDTGPVLQPARARYRASRYGGKPCRSARHASAGSSCAKPSMNWRSARAVRCRSRKSASPTRKKISKAEALIDWQEDAVGRLASHPGVQSFTRRRNAPGRSAAAHMGRAKLAPPVRVAAPSVRAARHRNLGRLGRRHRRGLRPGRAAHHAPAARRPQALAAHEFIKAQPLGGARFAQPMSTAAAGARSLAVHAVARVLREGVTLDEALQGALRRGAAQPLAPSVRSLEFWSGARILPPRGAFSAACCRSR